MAAKPWSGSEPGESPLSPVDLEGYGRVPHWVYVYYQQVETEGRLDEWRREWELAVQRYPGRSAWFVSGHVSKQMGHDAKWEKRQPSRTRYVEARIAEEERNFDDVVGNLPLTASYGDELDWVSTHPKISAMRRSPKKRIILGARDILQPPNGPCPSQRAARLLQQFVDSPGLFWKLVQEYQKRFGQNDAKNGRKVVESEEVEDLTLPELERLLKEVS